MSELIQLANAAIAHYLKNPEKEFTMPDYAQAFTKQKNGVFITIYKNKQLRACLGTIGPTQPNLAMEIVVNAASACQDPRYPAITLKDFPLAIRLDILETPEPVDSVTDLDYQKYGVIVVKDEKRGLTLPNFPGITSLEQQLAAAQQKAGITDGLYGCSLFRFTSQIINS